MRHYIGLGLAMIAGAAIGAAGVSVLHAQAKPPVFQVTIQDVSDLDAFNKDYVPNARATIKANGGISLASSVPVMIEGAPIKGRVVVNQWESVDQIKKWHASAEYQKAREIGNKYAKFQIMAVEGLPKQ